MKKALPQAEFFLETMAPEGNRVLWEALTASEQNGLTLLLGREGEGPLSAAAQLAEAAEAREIAAHRLLSPLDPRRVAGITAAERGFSAYCAGIGEYDGWALPNVCEREVNCVGWLSGIPADLRGQLAELARCRRRETLQALRLLRAAVLLLRENNQKLADAMDPAKLSRTARHLFQKECGRGGRGSGREEKRFLTALTGSGFITCEKTPALLADRAILIDDPFGDAAAQLLGVVREELLAAGQGFISCWSPLEPDKLAHLILPDRSLCFLSVSSPIPAPKFPANNRAVHYTRFVSLSRLEACRQKIRFTRRMADELLREAAEAYARGAEARLTAMSLTRQYLPREFIRRQKAQALAMAIEQLE
ncbi:MAG: hypothetical protein HFE45_01225 [Oscillospiraceae bacterium]|nr:hypothetical protein [Oscillospiraceae bacterium]